MVKIGSGFMKGEFKSFLKITTPAYTHCSSTYHDLIHNELELLEETLCLMQEHDLLSDPLERIKYLTAARLGSFSIGSGKFGLRQPLNPILGETGIWTTARGSQLYFEQTSHHPPITHFHFIGPK